MTTLDDPTTLFNDFLVAACKWESEAYVRCDDWNESAEGKSFYEHAIPELKTLFQPYCTSKCIESIVRLDMLQSGGRYGSKGGHVVNCEINGAKARITTKGYNDFPDSDARFVYLLVIEDGHWKIDAKKELSASGRERKVDLF